MAYHKNNLSFEKMLLKFIGEPDPMLSMLEWLCHKMMEVEVTSKLGASKNEDDMSLGIGIFSESHSGLDFTPIADNKSFQAVSSGKVEWVEKVLLDPNGNYQVNILIRYNNTYRSLCE